ncbi:MAG: hypothetical protein IT206_00445 [Fimbriimonadaceae bacterium]|nr:hypothetical protein [Fimbriimonadaceae bacterium]
MFPIWRKMEHSMYPSIALARCYVADESLGLVDEIAQQVAQSAMSGDRNEALSLWVDPMNPGNHLAIASCLVDSPDDNAWTHMITLAGEGRIESAFGAPDVHPVLPHRIHGSPARKIEVGQCCSLSMRRADPGYSDTLLEEMSDIVESLRYLDGYLGSIVGTNPALPEEIIGLVFWQDQFSYEESNPHKGLYEIWLFERMI